MERFGWTTRGFFQRFSHRQLSGLAVSWSDRSSSPTGNFADLRGVGVHGFNWKSTDGSHRRSAVSGSDKNTSENPSADTAGHFAPDSRTEGEGESPLMRRKRLEAVLFLSRSPIPGRKLSQLAGLADATEARTLIRQLNQVYAETGRAFRAEEVAGGYVLLTRPPLAPWLRRLGHIPKTLQLTPPAMETLAIVAYRQPVLRAEIEAIRGVSCGEILRQLMDRDLVRISGRSEELGRPYLYSTTKSFLQTFGFRDADALPALDRSEFTISENPDWSNAGASSDPSHDQQQPVNDVPEEESDVSTAVANLVIHNPECDDVASVGLFPGQEIVPVLASDDDDDDMFEDDDEDDDFEDDDDDWDGDDDDLEDDDEDEELDVESDADWEEVEDEDEADEEEDDEDEDEDDDWDDEDDEDDDWDDDEDDIEEDDEEWD